jgi:hypothetical protein
MQPGPWPSCHELPWLITPIKMAPFRYALPVEWSASTTATTSPVRNLPAQTHSPYLGRSRRCPDPRTPDSAPIRTHDPRGQNMGHRDADRAVASFLDVHAVNNRGSSLRTVMWR